MPSQASANPYTQNLDKCAANYQPLTPLTFLQRAAEVYPAHTAVIHGKLRLTYAEIFKRDRLAGKLPQVGHAQRARRGQSCQATRFGSKEIRRRGAPNLDEHAASIVHAQTMEAVGQSRYELIEPGHTAIVARWRHSCIARRAPAARRPRPSARCERARTRQCPLQEPSLPFLSAEQLPSLPFFGSLLNSKW